MGVRELGRSHGPWFPSGRKIPLPLRKPIKVRLKQELAHILYGWMLELEEKQQKLT